MAALMDEHGRALASLLARRGCPPDDRADIVQRAWVRAYEARERLDPERPFGAWIGRIATHLWWDDLKRQRTRRAAGEVDGAAERLGAVPAAASDALEHQHVQAAIAVLPFDQREALLLTQYEGLSIEEAAAEAGTGISAMKSRVSRAYTALRVVLAAEDPGVELPDRRTVELQVAGCARCDEVEALVRSLACPSCEVTVTEREGDGPRLVVDGESVDGLAGSLGYRGTLRALGIGLCSDPER